MIRFLVNGEYLDLPADFSLQFKKTNILFAFDKIECERSTSFDIPATPQNDRIFELSRWIQAPGNGMRHRYDAQMQSGLVSKDGYLYVDAYSGGKYKAVFVTGELFGLLKIREAGKIEDLIQTDEVTIFGNPPYSPLNGKAMLWACVKYAKREEPLHPSVRLQPILDTALQNLGVNWTPPSTPAYIRYIPGELNGMKKQQVSMGCVSYYMPTDGTYPICYDTNIYGLQPEMFGTDEAKVQRQVRNGTQVVSTFRGTVRQLVAHQETKITFPDNWDDDYFIGYFVNNDTHYISEFSFYGNRSFDVLHSLTGESLRGRTVTIPSGGKFTIINMYDYVDNEIPGGWEQGWNFRDLDANVTINGGSIISGDVVRLQDNLPDVTVTELLKTFAVLSGKQLYYTDSDGVTFDDLDFDTWGIIDITGKVLNQKEIMRKFGDYAQNNIVQFDEDDSVPAAEKISISYTIDNDNIEESKELQTIPFSEGSSYGAAGNRTLLSTENEDTLADADTTESLMLRAQPLKNENLQSLCDASTSLTIDVCLSLLEYEQMQPRTRIYYDGVLYVWTEAQYSKDVVTLKLSKISA